MNVTQADRHRLEAIIAERSAPQKHVWRAKIIVATADGCGTAEIMCRSKLFRGSQSMTIGDQDHGRVPMPIAAVLAGIVHELFDLASG